MTNGEFMQTAQEALPIEKGLSHRLTVPELYRLQGALSNAIHDAAHDPSTPCPHEGTHWFSQTGYELCGQCGRRTGKVRENERDNVGPEEGISNQTL